MNFRVFYREGHYLRKEEMTTHVGLFYKEWVMETEIIDDI